MCTGNESSLLDCAAGEAIGSHNCDHSEDAGVRCQGEVEIIIRVNTLCSCLHIIASCDEGSTRLTLEGDIVDSVYLIEGNIEEFYFNKDELTRGRIEVCVGERYGTICDDNWDNEDASVICSQLGFSRYG